MAAQPAAASSEEARIFRVEEVSRGYMCRQIKFRSRRKQRELIEACRAGLVLLEAQTCRRLGVLQAWGQSGNQTESPQSWQGESETRNVGLQV